MSGPRLYYGDEQVDEQWWAAMGKRVLDAVDWFLTLSDISSSSSNSYSVIASIVVKVVYNIFETASGRVSVTSSNGLYIVRWIKGWAETPPPTVVIRLDRQTSSTPQHAEWKYFAEGYQTPTDCVFLLPSVVDTNMYLPPNLLSTRLRSYVKIWTWRGQTDVAIGTLP